MTPITPPLPGDVILYPALPSSVWSARIVGAAELLDGIGGGTTQYSHAAVKALSSGWQYEATFPFTCYSKIDTSRPYEIWRLGNPTPEHRATILAWCKAHVGDLYNIIGVLTLGLIELPGTYYCSQFACLAYAAAGLHPGDKIMSPNSIPEYPKARMIYRFTPPKEPLV